MSIVFTAPPGEIQGQWVIRVPQEASARLPSRGMVMVSGTINGKPLQSPLEPDGKGGHWLAADEPLRRQAGLQLGKTAEFDIEPMADWPEPDLPEDVSHRLQAEHLVEQWESLTTKARWEWLRWFRATKNPDTRAKRIGVACSKLSKGDRRPCCFNSASCTVPEVAKSGILLDATLRQLPETETSA